MTHDSITDIAGLSVGHCTLAERATGCTVLLCPQGVTAGVDVRGGAPGTRETELLAPGRLVDRVHAIVLTGGSAFGLDAAGGAMRWLEEHGHGFVVGAVRVPIVPAAVIFDLHHGDPRVRPDAQAGYAACQAAAHASGQRVAQGSVGAGAGATVGKLFGGERAMAGGIGTASVSAGGFTVGALIVVNATGDVIDPSDGQVVAGARRSAASLHLVRSHEALLRGEIPDRLQAGAATTIGAVATDAALDKAQCQALAAMAHDGLARTIAPVHTPFDGDTLFTLATGHAKHAASLALLGTLAAEATARAVLAAVRHAVGREGCPAARDLAAL